MRPKILRYLAYGEHALRNGSFWREIRWSKYDSSWAHYMNGDYMGSQPNRPDNPDLREFDPKVAKPLLPALG